MKSERKETMKRLMMIAAAAAVLCAAGDEEYISPVTGKPVPKDGKYTVEQIRSEEHTSELQSRI